MQKCSTRNSKVKSALVYCVKQINRCKRRTKIYGILYHHGGQPGIHYPDLEPGNELSVVNVRGG